MSELPTIPPEYHYILEGRCFPVVVTQRRDGLMSANPVSLLWDGETVRFSTQKARMKYKNLMHDERVTLCIMDPADPLCYVEVRGTARIEEDPDRYYINQVARKYLDRDEYPFDKPGDERVIVTVLPQQISARGIQLGVNAQGEPIKTG
jgi:PPOX class probable F420-dependent enzyme